MQDKGPLNIKINLGKSINEWRRFKLQNFLLSLCIGACPIIYMLGRKCNPLFVLPAAVLDSRQVTLITERKI